MLLIIAVFAGCLVGILSSWLSNRRYEIPHIRQSWLVLIAFFPQWLAFYLPLTRRLLANQWAITALIGSQVLLLVFIGQNLHQPRAHSRVGIYLLGLGLILNLAVILLNGGLMPIRPENVTRLVPDAPPGSWQVGSRLGTGKDIVLALSQTRLWWLSDYFYLPLPGRDIAFSVGDVTIALGAFILLCAWDGVQRISPSRDGSDPSTNIGVKNHV